VIEVVETIVFSILTFVTLALWPTNCFVSQAFTIKL
jgi:hypothetical protein